MAVTQKPGKPSFFVTWLTPILSGEANCKYRPWYQARYKYTGEDCIERGDFNQAAWESEHASMVEARVIELKKAGYKITTIENQNWIRLNGETAILTAKPDIIARGFGAAVVSDEKTGKKKSSHWWQVLTYISIVKRKGEKMKPPVTGIISGEIVYKDPGLGAITVQPEELTKLNEMKLFGLLKELGGPAPEATPSPMECAVCDIANCEFRSEDDPTIVETKEF